MNKQPNTLTELEAYEYLCKLPPSDIFWRNGWMFTKPVFTQMSRQMTDFKLFKRELAKLPKKTQELILKGGA